MPDKLPPDFNPEGYAAAYPDVALSGLSPREHYLRFGRLLGRSPTGKRSVGDSSAGKPKAPPEPNAAPAAPAEPAPASDRVEVRVAASQPSLTPAAPLEAGEAIVPRPDDFRAEEVVPSPAPPKTGGGVGGSFALDDFVSRALDSGGYGPLRAYARMVGIAEPVPADEQGPPSLCDRRFQSGDLRIENAWFADPLTLRLMIAGGEGTDSGAAGWAVRAFQAIPESPAQLRAAGPGIQLPARGPCFLDLALEHPLMPVVLELVQPDAATQGLALLPFPSLLAGGLHWAELKAGQDMSNPIDSFWSLSSRFVESLMANAAQRPALSVVADESDANYAALLDGMRDWLTLVFGVTGKDETAPKGAGVDLVLPSGAIPTIGALVSKRLADAAGSGQSYLIAEPDSRRPRWSVALPAVFGPAAGVPRLQRRGRGQSKTPAQRLPVNLAILFREPGHRELVAPDSGHSAPIPAMTVLLDATDAVRTEALLRQLDEQAGATGFELCVRTDGGEEMKATLDRVRGAEGWRRMGPEADLRLVAREARNDLLLTIDDRVALAGDTLARLCRLLDGGEDVASASCLLLSETVVKKQLVLHPGSGGLFPSGVSFIGGPSMIFTEPDVSDALADMTYPVVANTLALTVWRRAPLAESRDPAGSPSRGAQDIDIGLDLTLKGFRNLCTTSFAATIRAGHVRREVVDPLGVGIVQPGQWQSLLDRVTVVRELY